MPNQLKVSVGQHSDKGRKEINQDFHGVYIPQEPLLSLKGVVIALADGISSSDVSQIASEVAVTGFLADYFCTSEAWSVKKSAQRVLMATNTWLHSQSQQSQHRYNKDRGYVCTFSAMVIKSNTAHIFHAGDARIYRLQNHSLEQLTEDHRLWISQEKSYLSRALGINPSLEIDYLSLQVEQGDIFILVTDGTYEYTNAAFIVDAIYANKNDLDDAAKSIVNEAYKQGSGDNLSIQIVRVDELPNHDTNEIIQHITELPFPPMLEARMEFDGYKIIREVHASSRSHVYLAVDSEENTQVILKTPSVDKRNDQAYMDRFLMEEWIARRIDSPYVLKPCSLTRKRNYLYIVVEFIEGQTLNQWMIDNPNPSLENVRNVVEQIAKGLRAFHRLEMLHQDLQPNNIMIEATGMVKIIDFGSTRVAGLAELTSPIEQNTMLGTAAYTAPEYFLGEGGTTRSDLFSLAVITYQMLSGKLPYGAQVAKCRTKAAQNKLHYNSILDEKREIPVWIDDVLKKALHPKPCKRYEELTEFVYDLRHPNEEFLNKTRPPLMDRNPIIFWKSVSFILSIIVIILLSR
ncbi:MAG: bifunctional protein-serine/threonine kinase/phosphatase [Gammaproteobacteria bacterium]|jgi:serine/threonine protein kinase|nr:bifunctional protein-serine/threonine kinase/phosphatase [Gammaproteobacteria bacterium]